MTSKKSTKKAAPKRAVTAKAKVASKPKASATSKRPKAVVEDSEPMPTPIFDAPAPVTAPVVVAPVAASPVAAAPAVVAPVAAAPVAAAPVAAAPVAAAAVAAAPVAAAPVAAARPSAPPPAPSAPRSLPHHELEQLVRQEAFRLAQRRHFRDGTPEQDWFAAEAAVKAQLTARGYTLAS